jgi:hypothetical protein
MLFDLRGRGRRNTIKVIYITLAFLMGGGLVLFGIGGNTSGGGLLDAFTDGNSGGDVGADRYEKEIREARAQLATNPENEEAWVTLIRAQINLASTGDKFDSTTGEYNEAGQADLREAVASWNRYQAIEPKDKDEQSSLASRMTKAYTALGNQKEAVRMFEIVAIEQDSSGAWARYAFAAYAAGNIRVGDFASKEAIKREDPDQRNQLKGELESYKEQVAPAAVPSVTAAPTAEKNKKK